MAYQQEGSHLFKIHSYRLQRACEVIHIDVHELIRPHVNRFIAVPIDVPFYRRRCPREYYGEGSTETEALEVCLERIADLSREQILSEPLRPEP